MRNPILLFTQQGLFVKLGLMGTPKAFGNLRLFDGCLYLRVYK